MTETASVLDERKETIEARSQGLGGTDISAVVGMNPWKSAIDVYLGKLGLSERKDVSEPMFWGAAQESLIRDTYARRTGWKVAGPNQIAEMYEGQMWGSGEFQNVLLKHKEIPEVIGSPDGIVLTSERGLEIKTSAFKGEGWGKPGSDEVPVHYSLQCAQYMAITGLDVWDLAVLFSGNRLEIFTLHRNKEIEEQILAAAKWFWETHVVPKVPPPVDGSESYTRYLAKKYALGNQTYIDADHDTELLAAELKVVQTVKKAAEEAESRQKNLLADFIGENKGCYLPDGSRVQFIRPKPTEEMDWEGYSHRLEIDIETLGAAKVASWDSARKPFVSEKPNTPYIRLYEATQNQKRLKK